MKKGYGWMGTILRIDLSRGTIVKEPLSEYLAHNFIGGRGINSKILYDETGPGTEPLSPENRLIIGTGPNTGTLGPSAGRFTVTSKSPLTGFLGDGNGGGDFAVELKSAGYDHVVIQGKAEKPVYLWINDDEVIIKDARHLWGKNTWQTEDIIRGELGRDTRTMCIGQGGENLVRFACAVCTGDRAPSRTGTGAVMGSKNLKAIAARGTQSVKVADPEKYLQVVSRWYTDLYHQPFYPTLSGIGTSYLLKLSNESYRMSVRNSQECHLPEEEISHYYGENFSPKYRIRNWACFTCPTHCKKFSQARDGAYAGEKGMQPEGSPLWTYGPLVGCADYSLTLRATNLCNQYGLDNISAGDSIAAAMEWFQRGIITREDADGLDLTWGNKEAILELLRKMAIREGFGNILAEGAAKAARKIGKGAEKYEHEGPKGMGESMLRGLMPAGRALAYATGVRGYEHLRSMPGKVGLEKEKSVAYDSYEPLWAEAVIEQEQSFTATDALELCKWNTTEAFEKGFGVDRMAELLSAITGVDFSEDRLRQACNRIYSLEKAYQIREGMRREHDNPPRDFFERPVEQGPYKGFVIDRKKFEALKDIYYELEGWDKKTGGPSSERLRELGLGYVADELEKMGIFKESKT